jgi:exo-beta-1,3-glucanase (GH17 family)
MMCKMYIKLIRTGRSNRHPHHKRDVQVVQVPEVIVMVAANGVPYTTISTTVPVTTSITPVISTAPALAPASSATPAPKPATKPAPKPASIPKVASKPKVDVANTATGASGNGISYSPYNSDGTCKTGTQVSADFASMAAYPIIRLYGTDCNQVATGLAAAKQYGKKLFAGIFDINNAAGEAQIMIDAAQGDWSLFDTVSVGNEAVSSGKASVGQVVAAVNAIRSQLAGVGYTGPVVTADTVAAIIANPELCTSSDYACANAHAFFNSETEAANAGEFVQGQWKIVSDKCGKSKTVITESGWPTAGSCNGVACPTVANQITAVSSLKSAFASTPGNLFLFSAFNDQWKQNFDGSFGAEQFWGILN